MVKTLYCVKLLMKIRPRGAVTPATGCFDADRRLRLTFLGADADPKPVWFNACKFPSLVGLSNWFDGVPVSFSYLP